MTKVHIYAQRNAPGSRRHMRLQFLTYPLIQYCIIVLEHIAILQHTKLLNVSFSFKVETTDQPNICDCLILLAQHIATYVGKKPSKMVGNSASYLLNSWLIDRLK